MKRIISLMLMLTFVISISLSAFVGANASGAFDYTYIGLGEQGYAVDDFLTTLFKVEDGEANIQQVYCVDTQTFIQLGAKYSRENVGIADYYSKENADKIRAIMQNAYPYISLEELKTRSGIATLDSKEAITAIQLAVWKLSNNETLSFPTADTENLYNWLLALPPATVSNTPVGNIEIFQNVVTEDSKAKVTFAYKTDGVNVDGTPVVLNYSFDKDISSLYEAVITEKGENSQGYQIVEVSNLPLTAVFSIVVSGTQNVEFDGYFYSPEGGRDYSQSLIGAYSGNTELSEILPFEIPKQPGYSVKLHKIDSVTLAGLGGAEFAISNTKDFSGTVYIAATNPLGYLTFNDLSAGTWYIKETKSPLGYIPSEEIYTVTVSCKPVCVEIKNTAYGGLNIYKVDVAGQGLEGGVFDIYNEDNEKIFTGLVSDSTGLISVDNLLPGKYKVVETQAPNGFTPDPNPQYVDVKSGLRSTVTFVNERIPITAGNYSVMLLIGLSLMAISLTIIGVSVRKKKNHKI